MRPIFVHDPGEFLPALRFVPCAGFGIMAPRRAVVLLAPSADELLTEAKAIHATFRRFVASKKKKRRAHGGRRGVFVKTNSRGRR